MLQAFSQIDLFGKAVLFNYKGNAKSKSKIGAICTLILFGFIIWLAYYFGRTLFDKSNPNATSFESFNEDPSETPLTVSNFVFAIGIADPNTYVNFINESIYTIYGSTYKQVRNPQADGTVTIDYIQVPLQIETCTPDHFGDLNNTFSYLTLDTLYCLKVNQTDLTDGHPMLQGSFESPTFQSIYIYFSVCDNSTSPVTCGTHEEIDAKLGYMSLAYSNIAVDLTNSKQPLQKFRDGWYTTVGRTSYKEATLYLEQLEINTDNGFLTTDFKTESYVKFGEIREFLSLTPKSSFGYFSMRLSNVMTHYNRSYNKLQDVIAQVNGIVTVAFTILFIVLAPYVRLKFYEALINEIFDIKWSSGKSAGKNGKNAKKKAAKRAKKQNLKDNEDKDKSDKKVMSQEEDLEQQGSTFKPQDPGMSNMMELLDRKEKDLDLSIKRGPSLEDSVQGNISVLMPKYDLPSPKNSEPTEKKERLGFSKFRSAAPPTPLTVSRSQSEVNGQSELNVPMHLELLSPLESPLGSPDGSKLTITPRKPNFMKPSFKVLSYEEHGDDFFDDMHKIVQEDPQDSQDQQEPQFNKDGFVLSGLRSEMSMHHNAPGGGGENKWPRETALSNEPEEQKKGKSKDLDPHRKYRLQTMSAALSKFSGGVNLSFCEYLRSWVSRNDAIKEKMAVLDEGIKRINERLDIFNLFKKLREFDKLKVLLLEDEQFVLFDSLPKPELNVKNPVNAENSGLFSHSLIKDAQFIQDKRKKEMIVMSYERLKRKTRPTMVDQKLFDIYDNRFTQILQ